MKHSAVMFQVMSGFSQDWCSLGTWTVCPDRHPPQGSTDFFLFHLQRMTLLMTCNQMAEKWWIFPIFAGIPLLLHTCEHPFMYSMKKRKVASVMFDSLRPPDCSPPVSSVRGILRARILEWLAILFSRRSSPTQGLNPGLLNCKQMLYCLSHQGNAINFE